MSYILDALKKAERERGMPQGPRLTTGNDLRRTPRNRATAIAGGFLVCAFATFLFFLPALTRVFQSPKPAPISAEQNQASSQPETRSIPDPAVAKSAPSLVIPQAPYAPSNAGRSRDAAAVAPSEIKSGSRATAAAPAEPGNVAQDSAARISPEGGHRSSPSIPGEAASQRSISEPAGLASDEKPPQTALSAVNATAREAAPEPRDSQSRPASLQEAMARMTLNILVYEEAEADRKVYINGRKYVKGDFIEGHYLIENITLEGAVLSYEGVRALLRPR